MIKYLSVFTTTALCYFILQDVNRFIEVTELIVFTLSHFSVHIILRDIFNDQLSFSVYFITNMTIMFTKSFIISWLLFNQNYLDNPSCYYYIAITALQSIIFSKYILRRSLYQKLTSNSLAMYIINIGDKLCQSEFMIIVLLFQKNSLYLNFDLEILTLTAIGAWVLIPIVIVVMRDFGCSLLETYKNLFPWFENAGFVYFSSVLLTYEWERHIHHKSSFLLYFGQYFPALLTDEAIKIMVLLSFLLVETYYQLNWQKKQKKQLKLEEINQKKQVKKEKKKQHKVEKLEAEKSQVEVVKEEGKQQKQKKK